MPPNQKKSDLGHEPQPKRPRGPRKGQSPVRESGGPIRDEAAQHAVPPPPESGKHKPMVGQRISGIIQDVFDHGTILRVNFKSCGASYHGVVFTIKSDEQAPQLTFVSTQPSDNRQFFIDRLKKSIQDDVDRLKKSIQDDATRSSKDQDKA